jgi:hypothetical protein
MVTAAKTPIASPTLQRTNIIHGPAKNSGQMGGVADTSYSSANWSGIGVTLPVDHAAPAYADVLQAFRIEIIQEYTYG